MYSFVLVVCGVCGCECQKTEFPPEKGGFWMVLVGSHKTKSLRKVFGVLSLCLSFLVLVVRQMLVFYLFSLVSCQWRAQYVFCPLFVVLFYG